MIRTILIRPRHHLPVVVKPRARAAWNEGLSQGRNRRSSSCYRPRRHRRDRKWARAWQGRRKWRPRAESPARLRRAAARANHYFLLGRVKWDLGCSYLLVGSGWVYTEVAEGCSRSATAINLLANIFLRAAEPIRSRLLFHSDNPTHIHVLIVRGFPSCHHWTSKCAHTFTRARPPSTQIHSHIHTLLARLPRYSTLSSSSR